MPYIQDKLTRDPAYNVASAPSISSEMLQRFGGSYELALAAYNAGPNRVARWLDTIGDPRAGKIDMVDWIEMIPFRETRNYVQRIMEGVGVYRDRLNGPFRAVAAGDGPVVGFSGFSTFSTAWKTPRCRWHKAFRPLFSSFRESPHFFFTQYSDSALAWKLRERCRSFGASSCMAGAARPSCPSCEPGF